MKCPRFNGTGIVGGYNAVDLGYEDFECALCNGTGEVEPTYKQYDCEHCENWQRVTNGKSTDRICVFDGECEYLEQTNEEWFCGLPTEEKARFIALYGLRRTRQIKSNFDEEPIDSLRKSAELYPTLLVTEREITEWLKEKHNDN